MGISISKALAQSCKAHKEYIKTRTFLDGFDSNHMTHNSATTYVTGHKNTTSTKYMGTNINRQCFATTKKKKTPQVVHEWGCVQTKIEEL